MVLVPDERAAEGPTLVALQTVLSTHVCERWFDLYPNSRLFKPSHQGSLWAFRADVKGKPKAWVGEDMVSVPPLIATAGAVETTGAVGTMAEEATACGGEMADRVISFPIRLGDQVRVAVKRFGCRWSGASAYSTTHPPVPPATTTHRHRARSASSTSGRMRTRVNSPSAWPAPRPRRTEACRASPCRTGLLLARPTSTRPSTPVGTGGSLATCAI